MDYDEKSKFSADEIDAPLVDEALAATDRDPDLNRTHKLELEVARLQKALEETAAEAHKAAENAIKEKINDGPISAALAVGLVAFLYGLTR
ncbi:hypothetical protein [Rhizobium sp. PL01]|uniref:hypothetical protein n=1 Tax=Rhizobium sp. PL01 TaxID=3085631 RepID=UPI002981CD2C|nr:hypothetical protein [Rhizobium sp. PL01]MDW5318508.1 hypothetical protein [Rhizobium sp. PL01]